MYLRSCYINTNYVPFTLSRDAFHDGFGDGDWGHSSGPHTDAIGHSLSDICELVLDAQVLGSYFCHSRKMKVILLITELYFKEYNLPQHHCKKTLF